MSEHRTIEQRSIPYRRCRKCGKTGGKSKTRPVEHYRKAAAKRWAKKEQK